MKVIVTFSNAPVIAKEANQVVMDWQREHASYYGKPHGSRRILMGLDPQQCGYTVVSTPGKPAPYHRWLSCGGNDHRIAVWGDIVTLAFCGRRHGMRQEFRDLLEDYWEKHQMEVEVYHTRMPNWAPWSTNNYWGEGWETHPGLKKTGE